MTVQGSVNPLSQTEASLVSSHGAGIGTSADGIGDDELLRFKFLGSGAEYFRIWIVNIFLSLVTLGIYSAWAKVRNKQYFYGNTRLEGSVFEYRARPLAILLGRIIVVVAFIAYTLLGNLSVAGSLLALLLLLLAMPFFIQRGLMFNARYSSYRNIRFDFSGSFRESAVIFCGIPFLIFTAAAGLGKAGNELGQPVMGLLVALLVPCSAIPYFIYRQKRYLVDNSLYGTSGFQFSGRYRQFLVLCLQFLVSVLLALLLAAAMVFLMGWLLGISLGELQSKNVTQLPPATAFASVVALYTAFGVCYLLPYIYYSVKINNLVFNNCRLGDIELVCCYRLGSYARLVLVNTLLTLLTLGLYRPWARVNTARYKARHMALRTPTPIDSFVAGEQQSVSALGEEFGELYDLDFGF